MAGSGDASDGSVDTGLGGSAGASGDAAEAESDAAGCEAGPVGIASYGEPCCPAEARACAGHAQQAVLQCEPQQLVWIHAPSCDPGWACDTVNSLGTCKPIVAACVGQKPGALFCDGALKRTCGPDLVDAAVVAACSTPEHCELGLGQECAACLPGEHRCDHEYLETCAAEHMSFDKKAKCIDASLCDASLQACLPFACPTGGGPVMLQLPEGYCIDSTEVTRGQYQTWLQSLPSIDDQITACSWNTEYAPNEYCIASAVSFRQACVTPAPTPR
jgi:hypothetical protein